MSTTILPSTDRFIRLPEVQRLTGRSKTQIYDDKGFPRPVKLSLRESAWLESEVRAWMQTRVDLARGKAGEGQPTEARA